MTQDVAHDPVGAWNATHLPGARVRYWPGWRPEGRVLEGITIGPAFLMGGTPVVPVRSTGRASDCIALTHVELM